jgi:hypothetical protein
MARSKEILDLLDLIDEIDGMSIDYLWDFLRCEVESGSLSETFKFLDAEEVKELKTARGLVHKRAKAKQGPSRELSTECIETWTVFFATKETGFLTNISRVSNFRGFLTLLPGGKSLPRSQLSFSPVRG